ncbi:hypothetical protein [Gelidibacter mesophilus]|uniref:hypothetical protein n=1 Tax=Gelidibacter mesophilus TaxID=169050 RepID=UPI0004839EF8|nr:hypothetical protein [Gelidibacter mesophilus]
MKKSFLLLTAFICTLACKNPEKSSSKEMDAVEKSDHKSSDQSPCTLLTDAEIKSVLSIPSDTETSKEKKSITYPACFYKWESFTYPYKFSTGQTVDRPAELSIVWAININKKLYEQSISVYKDGEAINGLGDMATYSKKMGQITFLKNDNLFHVKAETSTDEASNKAKSITLAKLIADKL